MNNKGMASSSSIKHGPVPMDNVSVTPEATYEAVVADPNLFMSTLGKLHGQLGTKFMIPIIGGKMVDLHKLFVEVTSRGGINKIVEEKRWKEIVSTFVFSITATNASHVLRKYYFSLLLNYEQVYFFRANNQIPPGFNQGAIGPAEEVQALTSGSLVGSTVTGEIDGKFENGYLVTVTMGSGEKLSGVLYQLFPQNTTPQQSYGVAGGERKRRRRRTKSEIERRDPARPKQNRSSYNFFFSEQRAKLAKLHPDKERKMSRMIAELWYNLNEEGKSVYEEKAREDKERYQAEMQVYREKIRTGKLRANPSPLRLSLPKQDVDMPEADEGEEEDDEESDSSDSSDSSDESDSDDDDDSDYEEALLSLSVPNPNPNPSAFVVAPTEKTSDVGSSSMKKADDPSMKVVAEKP